MLPYPLCLLAISHLLTLPVCSQAISTTVVVATTVTSYYTAAAATAPLSPQYTNSLDLHTSILNSTNFYRYEHSASYIYWNTTLAQYAQSYSENCVWQHSHGPYGENLARGYANVTEAVDAWGNERSLYDFSSGDPTGFTEATGHFTQLVWKSTQTTGCGWTNCNGKNGLDGVFLVCEYYPAGNIVGDNNSYFKANISPQKNGGDSGFKEEAATQGATGGVLSSTTASSPGASATSSSGESVGNPNLEVGVSRVFATVCVTIAAVLFGWGMS